MYVRLTRALNYYLLTPVGYLFKFSVLLFQLISECSVSARSACHSGQRARAELSLNRRRYGINKQN